MLAVASLLAVGACVAVAAAAGFHSVLTVLSHVRPGWLIVALVAQLVAVVGYAASYREVLRVRGGPEVHPAWAGALTVMGFGAYLSKGGFSFDYGVIRRSPAGHEAHERVLGLGALEYALLAPAAWVSAVVLLLSGTAADPSVTYAWIIGLPVGSAIALGLLCRRHQLAARGGRWGRVATSLSSISLVWEMVRVRRHWAGLVGMAIYWSGEIGSLWAGLRAFGWSASIAATIVGFATGYALTRRTLPLAGAGITEALLSFSLHWVGIPLAVGLAGTVVYRFFNVWLPTLVSAPAARLHSRAAFSPPRVEPLRT